MQQNHQEVNVMALSVCWAVSTDQQGRELVEHGTTLFPVACYHDNHQ